jgi:hypothetical protein
MPNKAFVNTSPNADPLYKEVFAPEKPSNAMVRDIEINAAGTYVVGSSDTTYTDGKGNPLNSFFIPSTVDKMEIALIGPGGRAGSFSYTGGGGAGGVVHQMFTVTGYDPFTVTVGARDGISEGGVSKGPTNSTITATGLTTITAGYGGNGGGFDKSQAGGTVRTGSGGGASSSSSLHYAGSGGGAGGRAYTKTPSNENSPAGPTTYIANAITAGIEPGTQGLGHYGSAASSTTAVIFHPGQGINVMGRSVAGGGAGYATVTYFSGGYGAVANGDATTPAKYGAGGSGRASGGANGGPGAFIGRYIYNKPSGINRALTWWETPSGATENLASVAYGNGYFVACGASGRIIRSTNGKSWETVTSGTANNLWDIDFDGTYFYVVGNSSTYRRSTDGSSWSAYSVTGIPASTFDVIGGDVVGTLNSMNYRSSASAFSVWTGAGGVEGIAYGPGVGYVGVGSAGKIVFSTTLGGSITTVSPAPTANTLYTVIWSQSLGMFIAAGAANTILTSSNGTTWTSRTANVTTTFEALGASPDGCVVGAGTAGIMNASLDGITWRNRYSELGLVTSTRGTVSTSYGIKGIAYGSGTWVAVADGGKVVYAIG